VPADPDEYSLMLGPYIIIAMHPLLLETPSRSVAFNYFSLDSFSGTLKPATAFMTGQIKLRGDLAKALSLEKIMAAARDKALSSRKT
jgi:hypothetical protein